MKTDITVGDILEVPGLPQLFWVVKSITDTGIVVVEKP